MTRNEEIVKLRKEGWNQREIAAKFGITRQGVSLILIKNGIRGQAKRLWTEDDIEEAIERYRDGESVAELSREYGFGRKTLVSWLKLAGIKTRSLMEQHEVRNGDRNREIIRLYTEELLSPYQIGEIMGLSHQTIGRLLERRGVKMRGRVQSQQIRRARERASGD